MNDAMAFAIWFILAGLLFLGYGLYRFFTRSLIKAPPRSLQADYKDGHVELTWHPPSHVASTFRLWNRKERPSFDSPRNIVDGYVVSRYTYENHKVRDRSQGWVMDFTTEIHDLKKYVDHDPTKGEVHQYKVWPLDEKRRRGPAAKTRDIHIRDR